MSETTTDSTASPEPGDADQLKALIAAAERLAMPPELDLEQRPARRGRIVAGAAGTLALCLAATLVIRSASGGGSEAQAEAEPPATTAAVAAAGPVAEPEPATTLARATTTDAPATTRAAATTTDAPATTSAPATTAAASVASAPPTTAAPVTTSAPATTAPATTLAAVTPTTATSVVDPAVQTVVAPQLPTDPIISLEASGANFLPSNYMIYREGSMYLMGTVASEADAERVRAAALSVLPPARVVDRMEVADEAAPPSGLVEIQDGLLFGSGSAAIPAASNSVLDIMAIMLAKNPDSRARLSCHTDSVGSFADNLDLSQRRVDSVLVYITGTGIDRLRFDVSAKGESEPIADNASVDGRRRNRRCDIEFVGLIG